MNLFSGEDIPWALTFVMKALVFLVIVNVGVLPVLLFLRIPLGAYSLIIVFEGFCLVILGGYLVVMSLFSEYERYDYQYVGRGMSRSIRRDIVIRKLRREERKRMRRRGVIMIFLGLLLWAVELLVSRFSSIFYT